MDFYTLLAGHHASLPSKTSIKCQDAGGPFSDPAPGIGKQCFCVSADSASTIYFSSCAGTLWGLSADGQLRLAKNVNTSRTSPPVVDELGDIYIGSTDSVLAFHQDGTAKWTYVLGSSCYSLALGPLGKLYVGASDGLLYALDRNHGTLGWTYKTAGAILSSPTVSADGSVYVGSNDGALYSLHTNVRPPPTAQARRDQRSHSAPCSKRFLLTMRTRLPSLCAPTGNAQVEVPNGRRAVLDRTSRGQRRHRILWILSAGQQDLRGEC